MENEEIELESLKPKKRFKIFWYILITFIIFGALDAYGYYYFSRRQKSDLGELKNKVSDLTTQISTLTGTPATSTDDELDDLSDDPLDPNLTTKEYLSSKLGLSLRYPKDFNVKESSFEGMTYIFIDPDEIGAIPAQSEVPRMYFTMVNLQQSCSLSSVKSDADGAKVSNVNIAGAPGWKFFNATASELDGSFSTNYYFNRGEICYFISVENSDAKGTHPKEADDIVSSILFNK